MSSDVARIGQDSHEADEAQESLDRYQFLKILWGAVAFITCVFPVVNTFARLVPMPPELVAPMATISTILTLIAVSYVYTNRRELFAEARSALAFEDNQVSKISGSALAFTIVSMLSFFAYFMLIDVALVAPSLQNGAVAAPAYVFLLKPATILAYSLFFASTATAFNLMMMKLFMDEQTVPMASGPVVERRHFSH
ncbi:MAG TPA: hypothetical protein VMP10_03505 [Chloroflexota bacterium]|nr:hypothetical protein [Chloroflexota bacterium]